MKAILPLLLLLPLSAHADPACYDRVVHLPCAVARALPGAERAPACTAEPVHVSVRTQGDEPIDGALFEVDVERRPTATCPLPVEIRPAAERYPWCLIGDVQRDAVGDEPAVSPYRGACCGAGCRPVPGGVHEYVPIGPPSGYEAARLKRMTP